MLTCNPCRTPVDTDSKLAAAGDLVYDPTLYPRFVGALQYLTFTRPDISYVVQHVCLFMHDPREPYFSALKRILRLLFLDLVRRQSIGVLPMQWAELAGLRNLLRQHQRTKHIEIDIHFVRDLVTTGHIRVLHVPSRYQYADIFTKGLPTALFDEFRDSLSVRSSPAQTAEGMLAD
ncbi:ribonuclease H-like domain-containing protein [Tanacetum coccineum]